MTKIYIAAPWIDREQLPAIASQFEAQGHTITWKWWQTDDIAEGSSNEAKLEEQALHDLNGVLEAEALVLLNTKKSEGKAVEQGIAIANGTPIIAVGERGIESKNVFHYLSVYTWVPTIEEALCQLT